jgi:hypothetical protein
MKPLLIVPPPRRRRRGKLTVQLVSVLLWCLVLFFIVLLELLVRWL